MGTRPLQFFQYSWIFGNFNASSENFWILAVSKDKGFEFYRNIIELGPPTLQVSRRPFYQLSEILQTLEK